ncbi:MAG: aminoacyl-tRNA deacylase [Caldilineaceae bacterium]|nr:aminoacyl-tRNA deacylase [Caldilineaceae bacterium]
MEFKNNVTRFLEQKRVSFVVHLYDYDSGIHSATEVAEAIGLPAQQVFKTLVVLDEQPGAKPMLVLIPGPESLDLRQLAKGVRAKKVKMATHDQAEALTGLQTGGISPLALVNRGFRIFLDERARSFATIAVSAGQRGANLELDVNDLVKLVGARFVPLA